MKTIKVGIFGGGRGVDLVRYMLLLGVEIVALCEGDKERREEALKKLDKSVVAYENFDDFINHPMDAVVVTNNFHEHTPYVIKCFEKNLHVFSECLSNGTMGEGVELVRALKRAKAFI